MPRQTVLPGSSVRVSSKILHRMKRGTGTKRKGALVSAAYARRYPHLVRKEKWLYLHNLLPKPDPKTKKSALRWTIVERSKMIETEKILPVASFNDRHVRTTMNRKKVFHKLWANNRGEIRVAINGIADGKRIKEVIHVGFLKASWESMHNGFEKFKDHLVGVIVSNLRRRGVRLSNAKESAERIAGLKTDLAKHERDLLKLIDYGAKSSITSGLVEQIKWGKQAVKQQQRTKQLTRATIRIEKMIP